MESETRFEQDLRRQLSELAARAEPVADLDTMRTRGPAPRERNGSPRVFAAAIAVVVVVLGAGLAITVVRRGGDQQVATGGGAPSANESPVPLLVPTELPPGFAPFFFASQTIGGGQTAAYAQFFADLTATGSPRVMLQHVELLGGHEVPRSADGTVVMTEEGYGFPDGTPVRIGDKDGNVTTTTGADGPETVVWWWTGPKDFVLVKAVGLSEADTLALASSITPRADRPGFDVPDLPPGMSLVAEGDSGTAEPRHSNVASYLSETGAKIRLEATDTPLEVFPWDSMEGQPTKAVSINGSQALLIDGSDAKSTRFYLAWERAPGQWLLVDGSNVDEDAVVAAAKSAVQATPEAWTALEASNQVSGD